MFYCIVESLTTDNKKITFKNKTCSNNSLQFNCENKQGQRKAWHIPSPTKSQRGYIHVITLPSVRPQHLVHM